MNWIKLILMRRGEVWARTEVDRDYMTPPLFVFHMFRAHCIAPGDIVLMSGAERWRYASWPWGSWQVTPFDDEDAAIMWVAIKEYS